MKKKLFVLSFAYVALSLSACGTNQVSQNVELRVLDTFGGEYEINTPIDVGYLFYCSNYKLKSVTVTYNNGFNNVTEKVNGEIFIPSCSGIHKFVCSAGDKSVSKEVTVVDQKPFISVDSNTYFHVVDPSFSEIYLDDLTQNISTTYSPSTAHLEIDKVEYAPFNLKIDAPAKTYTQIPVTDDHFDAENKGHYKVYVSSVNGSRRAGAVYNVIVDSSINNGNEFVKKRTATKYCSTRVVVDESNPNAFLLPAADWKRGASFVTLKDEHEYTDSTGKETPYEIAIRFKGKNIPSIAYYAQPDKNSGSFSNSALTEGYILSWEQNGRTDRYTVTHASSNNVLKTVYDNTPEDLKLGIQHLDDNTYYRLTVGCISGYNGWSGYTYGHAFGWNIQKIVNYGTPDEKYENLFTPGPDDRRSETDFFLPYSFGGFADNNLDNKGYIVLYSSSLQDITFEIER